MHNFTYYAPTRIVFGKQTIARIAELIPRESKVLMLYGGGSIKRNGVYDQVSAALADHNWREFGGIEPNPLYETLMQAVEIVRNEGIDFLLAVGGGSVLDGSKFVAAAALHDGAEPWDMFADVGASIERAMPLGTVLTLPGTGSEMNGNAVVSRKSTRENLAIINERLFPRFSILDPEVTYTLPERQTVNGIVDTWIHVLEQYLTVDLNTPLQDRQAEAILTTLIEEGPKALKEPNDYDVRANIMWCATQALNGLLACGTAGDWATHGIGHELTAFFGIDHARTLAIVLPALLRHEKDGKRDKLIQYAARVWGVAEGGADERIEAGIARTEAFFRSLGVETKLEGYDEVNDAELAEIPGRFAVRGVKLGERQAIDAEAVGEILEMAR